MKDRSRKTVEESRKARPTSSIPSSYCLYHNISQTFSVSAKFFPILSVSVSANFPNQNRTDSISTNWFGKEPNRLHTQTDMKPNQTLMNVTQSTNFSINYMNWFGSNLGGLNLVRFQNEPTGSGRIGSVLVRKSRLGKDPIRKPSIHHQSPINQASVIR